MANTAAAEAEHRWKRYQYPPTLKLSERCWSGRRMPVMHRYRER